MILIKIIGESRIRASSCYVSKEFNYLFFLRVGIKHISVMFTLRHCAAVPRDLEIPISNNNLTLILPYKIFIHSLVIRRQH